MVAPLPEESTHLRFPNNRAIFSSYHAASALKSKGEQGGQRQEENFGGSGFIKGQSKKRSTSFSAR
jgi:hypothetical protein